MTSEEYYDSHGILDEITDEDVDLSLDDALRKDILSGKRKRKLRNVSMNTPRRRDGGVSLGKFY